MSVAMPEVPDQPDEPADHNGAELDHADFPDPDEFPPGVDA